MDAPKNQDGDARQPENKQVNIDFLYQEKVNFERLFQDNPAGILVTDVEGVILLANKTASDVLRLPADRLAGYQLGKLITTSTEQHTQLDFLREDLSVRNVEVTVSNIIWQGVPANLVMFYDITERKQAEVQVQHSNRALRTISGGNRALIHAQDEQKLLEEMCRVAVEQGGYRMAWVGYAMDDAEKSVQPVAVFGVDSEYLETLCITWADSERGQFPTGRAIRNRQTELCQDFQSDPRMAFWQAGAQQYGVAASIALPLMDGDRCFGTLSICSTERNAFTPAEVTLLEEMAEDLAYGIRALRSKQANQQHEQRQQQNMLKTVKAIASIVEMRDPYTSGHQARVAEIAQAIARQLELGEEEVQAIYLAALVHDLGKIRIPAEILSKPGRLTEVEYSLIKVHSEAGYDILKDIDFSMPIAQMVLQHHERMDGSGYPHGLRGDAILLGASILCVADVVDAMASHRPYRPGLGIDAALDEIGRGRGKLYAPQVVDACLAVFKENSSITHFYTL